MGRQYLIDSNAVIDYLGGKFQSEGLDFMNKTINEIPKISVITKIEVLGYNAPASTGELLNNFIAASLVLDLTEEVISKTIDLRKAYKIKTPDAIIGATAMVFDLILITRNKTDFKNIEGLQLLNPWELKQTP